MRLEEIGIQLRPRGASEALDLGRVMMQAWYGGAWRAWALTYLAIGLPLLAVLWKHELIALLVIWWLKPFCDRALLFAYSRALFGESTRWREIWRALPGLLKSTGLFSALTYRRFGLRRAFLLPVWQLEGQRGKAARQRSRVLSSRVDNLSVGLTLFSLCISFFLALSLLMLIDMFVPRGHESIVKLDDWLSGNISTTGAVILILAIITAESIVEPFYIASGFALYLNRRSELEGWDIEQALRKMSVRKAER